MFLHDVVVADTPERLPPLNVTVCGALAKFAKFREAGLLTNDGLAAGAGTELVEPPPQATIASDSRPAANATEQRILVVEVKNILSDLQSKSSLASNKRKCLHRGFSGLFAE
jgi:hypothetical protein